MLAGRGGEAHELAEEGIHGRRVVGADQNRPARNGVVPQLDLHAEVAGQVRQDPLRAGKAKGVGAGLYAGVATVLIEQGLDALVEIADGEEAIAGFWDPP